MIGLVLEQLFASIPHSADAPQHLAKQLESNPCDLTREEAPMKRSGQTLLGQRGGVSISCSTLSTLWVTAAPLPHLTVLLGHPLVPPFDDSHTKCDATMMPTYPQMYLLRLKLQFWAENRQLERWPFPFPTINSQHFVCLIVDLIKLFLQFLFPRP